jgi:hypothetical protein
MVDVEEAGLWLACDDLKNRLGPAHEIAAAWTSPITAFFPFSQILYVIDPSQFAALARGRQSPAPPSSATPAAPRDAKREHPRREGRQKLKDSKGRR